MKNITIILLTLILLSPMALFAQGGPPATPIDGGLSLLLAAGGAFGLKRLKDARKN